ncbi:MAG: hypothetical protein EZS28_028911 [Streblomastix strix]|uniref:Uncharacterized protein n=1 Tax=Streblomastix strix TaxID=222440 RepID=A0A5J4UZC4_9EUKA|nr:MAG: hypothetical protein EZS28_028911 [Streblomastix strix]
MIDIASARANAAVVTLQSPLINLDTIEYCSLIDGSYGKKYIGTSSNGVANRRSDIDRGCKQEFINSMISELFIADAADVNVCCARTETSVC